MNSDEDLLKRYQKGCLKSFEDFYDKNYKLVFHYLLSRVTSSEVAEDLLQDSFLKLHKSIMNYNSSQKALPWFFTIVKNTLIDFYRKKKDVAVENMDLFINKFIDKVSESDDLEDLLNYLSKEDRRILENRFFKEKTYEEMAADENSTLIALRKRVSRILAKLRLKVES